MLLQELLSLDKQNIVKWGNEFITAVFDIINKKYAPNKLPVLALKAQVKKITNQGNNTSMMKFKTSSKGVDVEFILDFLKNKLVMVTCEFGDGREDIDGWNGHTELDVEFDIDRISPKSAAKKYFNHDDKRRSLNNLITMFYDKDN